MNRVRLGFSLTLAVAWLFAGGCRSPEFTEKQAERDRRMQRNMERFAAREARDRENIDELFATHQKMVGRSVESSEWLDETVARRIQRRQAERRRHITDFFELFHKEDPERIPDTWAKMFY